MIAALDALQIVMIEDDDGHARLIEKNIHRSGLHQPITRLADGTSALAYLFGDTRPLSPSAPPLMILLDLNLPDMSGIDILRTIKAHREFKKTPVIVLTTTDEKSEIERCYELGCNVYITKPLHYESFAKAIRQLGLFLSVIQLPEQSST